MNVIELSVHCGNYAWVEWPPCWKRASTGASRAMAPIDLISCLVSDELTRRSDRLLERRRKQAGFRDVNKTLDNFDFAFNAKMNRSLVFDLATCGFIAKRDDALFLERFRTVNTSSM